MHSGLELPSQVFCITPKGETIALWFDNMSVVWWAVAAGKGPVDPRFPSEFDLITVHILFDLISNSSSRNSS